MSAEQERREWQRKQRDRDRLIEQVELGKLEPDEAEAEAARLGVAPLAITPDPNRFDPHKEARWTVLMVLAWIMWRDDDHVREFWDSYREKSTEWLPNRTVHAGYVLKSRGKATWLTLDTSAAVERVTGKPSSRGVAAAREDLWRELQEGKLRATGIDTTTERRVEIPALDWLELELVEHVQDPSKGDEVRRRGLVFGGYRDVRVPSADVRNCFTAAGEKPILAETKAETPTPEEPPKHPGGRSTKYQWDRIAGEVFRRVWVDNLPENYQHFTKEIFEWCEQEFGKGNAPDTDNLRKHISRWLAGVKLEEK